MGTTLANFQSVGNMSVVMDLLKRSEKCFDTLEEVSEILVFE